MNINLPPREENVLDFNVITVVPYNLSGSLPATAGNFGTMFTARIGYMFAGVSLVFRTASTSGTFDVEKCASGVAADSGTALLSSTISLSGTADTPIHGTLITAKTNLIIKRGDRLIAKDGGNLANLADLNVTLYLKKI